LKGKTKFIKRLNKIKVKENEILPNSLSLVCQRGIDNDGIISAEELLASARID